MNATALLNDPVYSAHDPSFDEPKAHFLLTRAYELIDTMELSFSEALKQAEKEWQG